MISLEKLRDKLMSSAGMLLSIVVVVMMEAEAMGLEGKVVE